MIPPADAHDRSSIKTLKEKSMTNMRKSGLAGMAAVAALALWGASLPAMAQEYGGMSCDELWSERNAIYKEAGYCFRTRRAINAFGNAGCRYDDMNEVPLSSNARRDVADIQAWERRRGCPR